MKPLPKAVIGPQTNVLIFGSEKHAFFPVIDPLPVCKVVAHKLPEMRVLRRRVA